jgi:hypothetical protein
MRCQQVISDIKHNVSKLQDHSARIADVGPAAAISLNVTPSQTGTNENGWQHFGPLRWKRRNFSSETKMKRKYQETSALSGLSASQ